MSYNHLINQSSSPIFSVNYLIKTRCNSILSNFICKVFNLIKTLDSNKTEFSPNKCQLVKTTTRGQISTPSLHTPRNHLCSSSRINSICKIFKFNNAACSHNPDSSNTSSTSVMLPTTLTSLKVFTSNRATERSSLSRTIKGNAWSLAST